ncbi:MAG TPA: S8 family peptidase [Casimicrobiaceae bacterium]|nr:S8 family peptidase [Casimicrobiaceae bacterium]
MSTLRAAATLAALLLGSAVPAHAQPAPPARAIVQFKADAKLLAKAALPGVQGAARARAEVLAARHGLALAAGAEVGARTQVVTAAGMTSEALAARLAADPDVEFAVPDRRRRIAAAPNDPLYAPGVPGNGPAAGQWYLRAPAGGVASSIDIEPAWSVTTGSPSVVVAVLDTGVRFDHPDLQPVSAGGNLLPGHDMIASVDVANDGDGRDDDASDPGDWVTQEEKDAGGAFKECDAGGSSWHGTLVSGLIGALTNNGAGMASIGRTVRVLPVRVLGKCGGYDSDILAGMRWAAGLAVPNVPPNATPARVLNMSLGGDDACNAAYRNAVAEINAAGAVVVASAGNSAGHAVGAPGNCPGVIAVAALRHVGTKVGFSDLGPDVAIAAPGGNCVNVDAGAPCLYPILSTANDGAQVPGNATYSDSFRISVGTSFSAPLVAGTAALMLSARPSLTPAQVRSFLQGTSRPFPLSADPAVPRCAAPHVDATGKPVDQLECQCTTATCGAGMLDAGRAVAAAAAGVQTAPVVEYYNQALDHYFVTWLPSEIASLDAGTVIRGWVRTGLAFKAWTTPEAGSSPSCRYYIPPALGNSHFYGRDGSECEATRRNLPALELEEARFMHLALPTLGTCPANTIPVYRVFSNRADANHRYTTERAVRDQMVARGWVAEGEGADFVAMCAPR